MLDQLLYNFAYIRLFWMNVEVVSWIQVIVSEYIWQIKLYSSNAIQNFYSWTAVRAAQIVIIINVCVWRFYIFWFGNYDLNSAIEIKFKSRENIIHSRCRFLPFGCCIQSGIISIASESFVSMLFSYYILYNNFRVKYPKIEPIKYLLMTFRLY